jgi:hypothetical protein
MTTTLKNHSPIFKERIPIFHVVLRNIFKLIGVFIIAQTPVFLLRLLLRQDGFSFTNFESTAPDFTTGTFVIDSIIFLQGELALIFTVLCCAFLSENTIYGYAFKFIEVLRHGKGKFGKALIILLPLMLGKLLFFGVASALIPSSYCWALILLAPILFLTIFELLLLTAFSLRWETNWKTYIYCWNLARHEWGRIIAEYITSIIVIAVLACPVYLPIILILRNNIVRLPALSGIISDFLFLWVIIEMILLFLNLRISRDSQL